jgi:stage III sporulation protein AG
MKMSNFNFKNLFAIVRKNAPVLLVVLLGILLLLLPKSSSTAQKDSDLYTQDNNSIFSVQMQEQRLAAILSKIEGAGEVSVLLSVDSTGETIYAENSQTESAADADGTTEQSSVTEYVTIRTGSSTEMPVEIETVYPDYIGAIVAAQGADNATVQLALTEAVSATTGLGADKIIIVKMK